jgi:hypothetical protein
MQERANQDENFLSSICFTDECTHNEPNTQNTRYLSQENPRINLTILQESNTIRKLMFRL